MIQNGSGHRVTHWGTNYNIINIVLHFNVFKSAINDILSHTICNSIRQKLPIVSVHSNKSHWKQQIFKLLRMIISLKMLFPRSYQSQHPHTQVCLPHYF